MTDWSDAVHCLQAAYKMQSEAIVSAESAKNKGLTRAQELIEHARTHSPFYAKLYASIPEGAALEQYPVVTRSQLMNNFDHWACDPRINKDSANEFLATTHTIGDRYLSDYLLWTSSGTSGEKGIYVQDTFALSIYQSLMAVRYKHNDSTNDVWRMATASNRMVMIAALEGHFAGYVLWKWAAKLNPWLTGQTKTYTILQAVTEIVAQLNEWQPKYISSYPSMLTVLAKEQASGRLNLSPNCLWCGGEQLGEQQRLQIEQAFNCKLFEDYGASEAMNMAFACEHGKLHLNTDWFILEPVDENMQAVAPGQTSTSTLLTNLANKVQPIIRYDIGDSICISETPCPCGNPLPTLQVIGRTSDTLWLPAENGDLCAILPLTLNTIVEENAKEFIFQIIQREAQTLAIRTAGKNKTIRKQAFANISESLQQYFASLHLLAVKLVHDTESPERDAISGKMKQVVALK